MPGGNAGYKDNSSQRSFSLFEQAYFVKKNGMLNKYQGIA